MAQPEETEGSWRGSSVTDAALKRVRDSGALGPDTAMEARLPPEDEVVPQPRDGEHVVFVDHIHRGMGFPVSPFFREFLEIGRAHV